MQLYMTNYHNYVTATRQNNHLESGVLRCHYAVCISLKEVF